MKKSITGAILVSVMAIGVPAAQAEVIEGGAPPNAEAVVQVLGIEVTPPSAFERVMADAGRSPLDAARAAALEGTG